MKKTLLRLISLSAIFLSVILMINASKVLATESMVEHTQPLINNEVEKEEPTVYDNDLFDAEEDLYLEGKTIKGNAFLAGKEVSLYNSTVEGSVFIASEKVKIQNCTITGSIFAAGENVTVVGTKANNIYTGANEAKVFRGTELRNNLYIGCSKLYFDAKVKDVFGGMEEATFDRNTVINNCKIEMGQEPSVDNQAKIEQNNIKINESKEAKVENISIGRIIARKIVKVVKYVIVVTLFSLIFVYLTRIGKKIKEYTTKDVVLNGLIGFATIIFAPIIAILLLFTGILAKFSIVILVFYLLGFVVSAALFNMWLTSIITKKAKKEGNKNFFLFTALVALCTALVELIPFIGAMVGCIIALAGYGLFIKLLIDNKK